MKEPTFWHETDLKARGSAPLTRIALTPVAGLYAWAGARRIQTTTPFIADIPVICIGNLTVGGSGKTPIVAALRDYFKQKGVRAASLSRGYKGELSGPLKVKPGEHSARDVGDEPLMLAMSGEAWIGADRPEAAKAMMADGVELILMDDGHQNPTLHKDVSLVVIDGGNPIGNGFVFPKGPLREPVEEGLSRADAVLIMGSLSEKVAALSSFDHPILNLALMPTQPPPKGLLVAFAGIGRPQKFFDTLIGSGAEIAEDVPFPDHHTYSDADLSYLRQLASERGARLITTEKDHARLPEAERSDILSFPVRVTLDTDKLDEIFASVLKRLS